MSETGSDVTNRKLDHGVSSVSHTYFLSNMHRFKVILVFVIVDYGEMSVSTARGRLKLEVLSPVDRATTVSYQCPIHVSCLLYTVHMLFTFFHWSFMAVCRFRPLWGVLNRKLRRRSIV
jgi:hypothetical protein